MGILLSVLVVWVLMTALFVSISQVGYTWVIMWLAEQDVWWSPYRMRPAPGHVVMMTKGKEPGGPFAMVLTGHIPGWHYHEGDRQFYKEDDSLFAGKFPAGPTKPKGRVEKAGAVKVGLFRRYYKRKRRWEVLDLVPTQGAGGKPKYEIVMKETTPENEHIFYFSTTMGLYLEQVARDNWPAKVKVGFNTLLINPEKAEFVAGKWEVRTVSAISSRARQYISTKDSDELRDEKDTEESKDFVDYLALVNAPQGKTGTVGLVDGYGVMVEGVYFEDFDLESGDAEMFAAKKRTTIAEQDFKTEEILSNKKEVEGQGNSRKRAAEAQGIREEFAARMSVPKGADLSMAEAVKAATNLKYLSINQGSGGVAVAVPEE